MANRDDMIKVISDTMNYCHATICDRCPNRSSDSYVHCISSLIADRLMGVKVKPTDSVITLTSNDIHELDRAIGGLAVIGEIIAASNAESISGVMNQALDILKGIVSRGDV